MPCLQCGLVPLEEADQKLEGQMCGFQDSLQIMQNNVQTLMDGVQELGDRMGGLEEGICILQCSSDQAITIVRMCVSKQLGYDFTQYLFLAIESINRAKWSIGHQQLATVPSDGHHQANANVANLQLASSFHCHWS